MIDPLIIVSHSRVFAKSSRRVLRSKERSTGESKSSISDNLIIPWARISSLEGDSDNLLFEAMAS